MNFYSQFGEDKFLVENNHINITKKGFFLDIGAGDPTRISNTWFLEENGWDGICIDGDPRNAERLVEKRKRVISGVIAKYDGLIDFNLSFHGADLSSSVYKKEGTIIKTACFSVKTLFNRFIPEIDLLSIDIEGAEIPILGDIFLFRKPRIIIVEYDKIENDVEGFMTGKGYEIIHRTQANLIYKKI